MADIPLLTGRQLRFPIDTYNRDRLLAVVNEHSTRLNSFGAQQTAGRTDLVAPTTRAAAEALALRTVGALVKIGSDGKPADASVTDAQLATLAPGGWLDRFSKLAATYAPGAVECREFHCQNFPTDANATAATMQGGGLTYANRAIVRPTPVLIANAKTEPWAVAFDMVTAVPTTGKFAWFGLIAADPSSNGVSLWNNYDATFYTDLKLRIYNGNTTTVADGWTIDTGRHTVMITFDLTTVRLIVDGVVKASTTTLTYLSAVPMGPYLYSDAGWLTVSRIATATVY